MSQLSAPTGPLVKNAVHWLLRLSALFLLVIGGRRGMRRTTGHADESGADEPAGNRIA